MVTSEWVNSISQDLTCDLGLCSFEIQVAPTLESSWKGVLNSSVENKEI